MREGGIDTQADGGFSKDHVESRVRWRSARHNARKPISMRLFRPMSLHVFIHAASRQRPDSDSCSHGTGRPPPIASRAFRQEMMRTATEQTASNDSFWKEAV